MALLPRQIGGAVLVTALVVALSCLDLSFGHESHAHHHHCDHGHHHHHHHHEEERLASKLLPEELAEEEDMRLYGFGFEHDRILDRFAFSDLSGLGLWVNALGCSLLVSMASLICLIILPLIFVQGKPSKVVVDSLALFGAGAMLGDAFLHQLPHAFGGEHSHSHDHHAEHDHHDHFGHEPSHSHSLKDLSVGISILAGIVVFLLVEKLVRYVEGNSGGAHAWGHGHHHHHHKGSKKLKDDSDSTDIKQSQSSDGKDGKTLEMSSEGKVSDEVSNDSLNGDDLRHESLRKRTAAGARKDEADVDTANGSADDTHSMEKDDIHSKEKEPAQSPSNLVFGYLNLFSDGVHNFTDGMALGSAFLLYGSVGGWSRTLFLLAHELPQECVRYWLLYQDEACSFLNVQS
ncbi:IAA-alanine resistance protein 1 isoform X2 [Quercus robur]|uniref:IAA-alanine resistance protein 1 isoform X2 n=1 Tax=Quercus robur TaxID=38942 RepID=UPI00216176CA|nr:IAA-alanine resistance protein 1 isoform X2 [Quercus robur]